MRMNIPENKVRITINGDENREITFNPHDASFVSRFVRMIDAVEKKEQECEEKLNEITNIKGENRYGIPLRVKEEVKLTEEVCDFVRKQIDDIFGEGTCDIVFGKENVLDAFVQFFLEVGRIIDEAREKEIGRYINKDSDGVLR